ncbi:GFA family protein [Novosphingobium sp. Gsoil 351]|uniref:GFA family protein n=1 Tax=Novosphingobium sp. Gsoil 351 TaxID=2675225 RepID=UPI001E30FA57|nr:GFA family protein [Novosphingobium sp. Gsoil 351]
MKHHAVCHCEDCRRCAGALQVPWIAFSPEELTVTEGRPKVYRSSEHGRRHFCGDCGTGLFYFNEVMLPGIVDIQSATLDDPEAFAPQAHIQVAESLAWESGLEALPKFDRYPG